MKLTEAVGDSIPRRDASAFYKERVRPVITLVEDPVTGEPVGYQMMIYMGHDRAGAYPSDIERAQRFLDQYFTDGSLDMAGITAYNLGDDFVVESADLGQLQALRIAMGRQGYPTKKLAV